MLIMHIELCYSSLYIERCVYSFGNGIGPFRLPARHLVPVSQFILSLQDSVAATKYSVFRRSQDILSLHSYKVASGEVV